MPVWKKLFHLSDRIFVNRWLESQQKSILSAATVITVANLLVSVSGLVRDRFMLSQFAGSGETLLSYDAFRVAFQVPDMIYNLLVIGALSASFVPLFTIVKKTDTKRAFRLTNIWLNYLLSFFVAISLLVIIFAEPISRSRIGEAYTSEQLEIVINCTRIMMIGQLFFAISSFLTGMLQSFQRFIVPAVAPLLYNGGIILGTWLLAPTLGIYGAACGVLLGAFTHMAIQIPFVHRLGWRYQWDWDWKFKGVKQLFGLMPARTFTLGMNEIQNFGLSYFITTVAGVGYTLFSLARSLVNMPIRFVGVPIGQASLPFLSNLSDEEDVSRFKKIVLQSMNQIAYLACPVAVLLIILRIPIVRLIFGTRNFAWNLTVMVGRMVAIMAVSIPMQAMFHLLVRAFHALRDTLTPFLIALCITCVFFIGCALSVQMPENQLYGIAWTICIMAFLETFLYVYFLNRRVKHLLTREFVVTQLKIYTMSVIMAMSLYIPFKLLDNLVFNTSRVIPLLALTGITSVVGLTVYILLSKLLHIEELKIITDLWKSRQRQPPQKLYLPVPPTEMIVDNAENAQMV
ncbi:murein biosynthesis integral membrane protein MurJ [bacterium]|nr:murein biosynthesis integral membrane protein MurJ [bacterium]